MQWIKELRPFTILTAAPAKTIVAAPALISGNSYQLGSFRTIYFFPVIYSWAFLLEIPT